ncbi:hypothetical protein PENTCL1PPCAC_7977, partial [Pristionchus entomophagus]
MSDPLLISIFHYAVSTVGTIANLLVLGMILTKTPRNLKCYSVLLFSQTLLQGSTCFTSGILFSRLIPRDFSVFFTMSGPAKLLGSYKIVFDLVAIMLHGHAHYCIMLAVCFSFRNIISMISLQTEFFMIQLSLKRPKLQYFYSQTPLFDPSSARELLAPGGPSYIFSDDVIVTGIVSVLEPGAGIGIIWVCAVIQFVGRLMYRTLAANIGHMSDKTRSVHKEIIRGLIFQACLPALYSFAVSAYVIGQLNILSLVALEYIPYMSGEIIVMTSPFLTLYFVHPYRRSISRVVSNKETT